MSKVSKFPGARAPEPAEGVMRAYAVTGCCEQGFLLGHIVRALPGDVDPQLAFRSIVDTAFDKIEGFQWGVVMGPRCVAKV